MPRTHKRDDFDFDIGNFPFLDGDVLRRASYSVYISQLIRFARVCNHVTDFNARYKCLTAKLLQQGYRYHKLRKTFSKLYRRHYELISKYNVGLKRYKSAKIRKRRNQKKIPTPKTEVGEKPNQQSGTYIMKTYRNPNEQLFSK